MMRNGVFSGLRLGTCQLGTLLRCGAMGEVYLAQQVRLLRFLEGGEVRCVGETKVTHVDVRVIAPCAPWWRRDI